jgi:hypothetical protein
MKMLGWIFGNAVSKYKRNSEHKRNIELIQNLRRDIDELKGNYQHNVVPALELTRDNMITNNHAISEIEDRLDAIESIMEPSPIEALEEFEHGREK